MEEPKEDKSEFIAIEEYLTPKLRMYYDEISKEGFDVRLLREYGNDGHWKLGISSPFLIVMPWNGLGNISMFAHELLHIYFDLVKGMRISEMSQIFMTAPYNSPEGDFLNQFTLNSIINNLQHHKMLPLYLDCGFQKDKFIANYNDFSEVESSINKFINFETQAQLIPFQKYAIALHVADYICLEKYCINLEHKSLLNEFYSSKVQSKYTYLYEQFSPLIESWDSHDNLIELVNKINDIAKLYAQND
jgi:hypothetical protein